MGASRVGGVISTLVFPSLIAGLQITGTAVLMAVLLAIVTGAGLLFAPETKGKTLEQLTVQ